MPTLKSYPHYEINVKDNSIQTVSVEEILPVHRPIYVLPTQEGPVGEPVWCESASVLRKIFGDETLNLANKKFATRQAFYLNSTISYNGAFVVRALNEDAKTSHFVLAAEVTDNVDIKQFETEEDGSLKIDMRATVYVNGVASTDATVVYGTQYYTKTGESFKVDNVEYEVFEPVIDAEEGDDASSYYVDCEEIENPNYGEYKLASNGDPKRGLQIEFVEYSVPSRYAASQDKLREYLQNLETAIGGSVISTQSIPGETEETVEYHSVSSADVTAGEYYISDGEGNYVLATTDNICVETEDTTVNRSKSYFAKVSFVAVAEPLRSQLHLYYEKVGGMFVETFDTTVDAEKTYYAVAEFTPVVFNAVTEPNADDIATYFEVVNVSTDESEQVLQYIKTTDVVIDSEKTYYVLAENVANIVLSACYEKSGDFYAKTSDAAFSAEKTYYVLANGTAIETGFTFVRGPRVSNNELITRIDTSIDTWFERRTIYEKVLVPVKKSTTRIYPILAFAASNPGIYGDDLGFRFFYKTSENDSATVQYYKTVFNSFSVVRRDYNSSTVNVLFDIYGRKYNTFSADPDSIDPESGIKNDMDSVLTNAFDTDNAQGTVFPYSIYTYEDQLAKIATQIIETEAAYGVDDDSRKEVAESLGFEDLGLSYTTEDQFAESIAYLKAHPFMINVLTCKNLKGVRYSCAEVVVSEGNDVKLDSDVNIMLKHGSDGGFFGNEEDQSVVDIDTRDNNIDRYNYQFFKMYLNDRIVDKFRYPFTHIYDVGYSMTTKYALIDFLNIRDDVMVELATQVCMPNKWVLGNGVGAPIKINDNAKDISNGLILRERALLMRESILKGTDCMRCAIYGHAGQPIAATYSDTIPFTFWSAMKHAQYGNTDQMSAQEPRGLPYSYNELFRNWNWINYSENIKEKTWNAGVNYCQFADMTRIFYPALRTVYREETSVLVDQWVVDALVYTKHECRKAWAKFSGRNDRRTNLESAIKEYLEYRLAYLYNGRYDFSVQVYKSIKDIDSSVSEAVNDEVSYVEHVRIKLAFPDTMRVLIFDIEVNRESQGSED